MRDYVPFNERPHGGHKKLLSLVGYPERVLDVGCSTGYLARRLVERGSTVVGIELDEEAAEKARAVCELVLVGDVETMDLPVELGSFDAVVGGDIIEHLRPGGFLERSGRSFGQRRLVLTPNVAMGDPTSLALRAMALHRPGILDRTHIHLFTRRTLVSS